jgi:hypothetical protein
VRPHSPHRPRAAPARGVGADDRAESVAAVVVSVTNRVFGEENPTPCTIVIVPGSVSYHVQNSLQNNIISIQ